MIKLLGARKEDLDINEMSHRPRTNRMKKLRSLKSPKLAREGVLGKHQERRFERRKQRKIVVAVTSYLMYHFEEWSKNESKGSRPMYNMTRIESLTMRPD